MKEDRKVYLVDIREELQSFMHYDNPHDAFIAGWESWMKFCIRHRFRESSFFYDALKRGWIARADAESLCNYLHKTHFWRCIA